MTVLRASLTIRCNDCGTERTFAHEGPIGPNENPPDEGWLFSEARDLCPPCLKRENDRVAGRLAPEAQQGSKDVTS